MSRVISEETRLVSTDLGILTVETRQVQGYDIEDLVRGRAISLARKLQFQNIAPAIDRSQATNDRTIQSVFLKDLEAG